MTGRTHDLVAFTSINSAFLLLAPPHMTMGTILAAVAGGFVGGLLPDIDDQTALFWQRIPLGTFLGKLLHPFIGHHRMMTHSIAGLVLAGFLLRSVLTALKTTILVDMDIVWWATMIGYVSHLAADSVTHEGIPLLFPIPYKFGFPPIKMLRIKTGGFIEMALIFPALIAVNGYLFVAYYQTYVAFFRTALACITFLNIM
jgi:inner membrane protein